MFVDSQSIFFEIHPLTEGQKTIVPLKINVHCCNEANQSDVESLAVLNPVLLRLAQGSARQLNVIRSCYPHFFLVSFGPSFIRSFLK